MEGKCAGGRGRGEKSPNLAQKEIKNKNEGGDLRPFQKEQKKKRKEVRGKRGKRQKKSSKQKRMLKKVS